MRTITLIGAPSGAGKSTYARTLMEQGHQASISFDFKKLPAQLPDHCIVEVATNKWAKTTASHRWHDLLLHIGTYDRIHCVHISINQRELAKRYLGRLLFEYPWRNKLKPRAWILGLSYLWPGKVVRSEQAWHEFEQYLIARYPERLLVLRLKTVEGQHGSAAQEPQKATSSA